MSVVERYCNLEAKLSEEILKQGKNSQVIRRCLMNIQSIGAGAVFRREGYQEIRLYEETRSCNSEALCRKQFAETEEFLLNTKCNGHILFCVCIYCAFLFVTPDYKPFWVRPSCLFGTNSAIIRFRVHLNKGYTCYINPLPETG